MDNENSIQNNSIVIKTNAYWVRVSFMIIIVMLIIFVFLNIINLINGKDRYIFYLLLQHLFYS